MVVSYTKHRGPKRVRKTEPKATPSVSSPLRLLSAKRCGCGCAGTWCLGEGCRPSPYAPIHTGRMGQRLTVKYSVPENGIQCYLVSVI